MKIALIGATGFVGARLLEEASSRGHDITAVVRDVSKLPADPPTVAVSVDINDVDALAKVLAGQDVVINAFAVKSADDVEATYLHGARAIVAAARQAGVPKLYVIGGAGSLFVAPGVQLVDTAHFPKEWKPGARGARQALTDLQDETAIHWTFVSPPPMLVPGERTGHYQLGGNDVPPGKGEELATISTADLAVAVLDDIEAPKHVRKRFTAYY